MPTYVSIRIDPVPAIVPSIIFNREDSAPAHITNVTQKRPPSSPDIISMDFAIWSILERDVSTRFYPNLDSLRLVIESNQVRRENGGAFLRFFESPSQTHDQSKKLPFRNLFCTLYFEYTSEKLFRSINIAQDISIEAEIKKKSQKNVITFCGFLSDPDRSALVKLILGDWFA